MNPTSTEFKEFNNVPLGQKIQDLMDMLTGGELPEGFTIGNRPQLTVEQAFNVVWFLQEHLRVIPDYYEMCDQCERIYNSEEEGHSLSEDQYEAGIDWYKNFDITLEMVMEHEGAHFCGNDCELQFWREATRP